MSVNDASVTAKLYGIERVGMCNSVAVDSSSLAKFDTIPISVSESVINTAFAVGNVLCLRM